MKALLDTNIVIYRENEIPSNYSIGHLYRWLDRLAYTKVIHPFTIEELRRLDDPSRRQAIETKIQAYEVLVGAAEPSQAFLSQLPSPQSDNDRIDNALLHEVYSGYVDLLITEDKRLRKKAKALGISTSVLSIDEFITIQTDKHPDLIIYKSLAVKKCTFREVNIDDPFFASFRADYSDFDKWFKSKSTEDAYLCQDESGRIMGFLYLKTEGIGENYLDIRPRFLPKKRLKIGTFKVESTGFRLGERFLKIVFDNALRRDVEEVYVTIMRGEHQPPQIEALIRLLTAWGFRLHGTKHSSNGIEDVYIKSLGGVDPDLSVKANFPNLEFYGPKKYFLPIEPRYHTDLIPDSILNTENPVDFLENRAHRYALEKAYISFSFVRGMNPGDYVVLYRKGEEGTTKAYSSVVSSLGVITELRDHFVSLEDFMTYCTNRTVFSDADLERFWKTKKGSLLVVQFILVASFRKRPILKELWNNRIVNPPGGPRPFDPLADSQFRTVLELGETEVNFVDRGAY